MKRCSDCRKQLPFDNFSRDRHAADGLSYRCRVCRAAVDRRYNQSEKGKLTRRRYDRRPSLAKYTKSEKFKIQQRRYRQSEKGKATSRLITQRLRQTEKVKLYEQEYRQSEKRRIAQKRYDTSKKGRLTQQRYRDTPQQKKAKQLYFQSHKEKIDKYHRAWLRTPEGKEYMIRRNFNRRTAVIQTPPMRRLTLTEWQEIKLQFHNACAYCGIPESASMKLTRDHLIPVKKGGLHTRENIVPACQPCNLRKAAKLLHSMVQ